MAVTTPCQTPGATYSIRIKPFVVGVSVLMMDELELSEEEAQILEANLHNAVELVLKPYWPRK